MDPTVLIIVEGLLVAGLVIGFCVWQIRDAKRALRKSRERERLRQDDN